jgi:hypothetical protein
MRIGNTCRCDSQSSSVDKLRETSVPSTSKNTAPRITVER